MFLLLLSSLARAVAQTSPVKLAAGTRFDLNASSSVGSITNGQLLMGSGSLDRMTWLAASQQPLTYTANLLVNHYAWNQVAVRFVPASNGFVTLTLSGPFEQVPASTLIYQEEVLWDALTATGATLINGSFENVVGVSFTGWLNHGGNAQVETGPPAPVLGLRYARTWQNRYLTQNIPVTGGVPVTLYFYVRAFFPANYPEMHPLTDLNSPAHQTARKCVRGVNLSNYLDGQPNAGSVTYSATDFNQIRSEGFTHVRLPIAWQYYTGPGPGYTVSNSIFGKVDFLATNTVSRGMSVIIDIHDFSEFITNPDATTNKFYAIWQQIAAHYSNSSAAVSFELLNEPNGAAATTAYMNPVYAEAIRQIRLSNPSRTIFVEPGNFGAIDELNNLRLPDNDSNVVAQVHCYDPFLFTHQGASWALPSTATKGIVYPGPPLSPVTPDPAVTNIDWVMSWLDHYNKFPADANPSSPLAFHDRLLYVKQWADYYGRPVHVGEFGAYKMYMDTSSRSRYLTAIRGTMDEFALGWSMWEWKAGFSYWNPTQSQPSTGMRDAIFPKPILRATGPGQFEFDSAMSKVFRIQRTTSLRTPVSTWSSIATQTLMQPKFTFADPSPTNSAAVYRVEWLK